jgi:hypothetical protein
MKRFTRLMRFVHSGSTVRGWMTSVSVYVYQQRNTPTAVSKFSRILYPFRSTVPGQNLETHFEIPWEAVKLSSLAHCQLKRRRGHLRSVCRNLILKGRLKTFKTRLTRAASEPPNFAEHYRFTVWGCGSNCACVHRSHERYGDPTADERRNFRFGSLDVVLAGVSRCWRFIARPSCRDSCR